MKRQRQPWLKFFFLFMLLSMAIPMAALGWYFQSAQTQQAEAPRLIVRQDQLPATFTPPKRPLLIESKPGLALIDDTSDTPRFTRTFQVQNPMRLMKQSQMAGFVDKIKNAKDEDERQESIDKAKTALEKQYEEYVSTYEKQIDQLESRLDKLKEQLEKRKKAKERLVNMKLELLVSEADGIGWPGENSASGWTAKANPIVSGLSRFPSQTSPSGTIAPVPRPSFSAPVQGRALTVPGTTYAPRQGQNGTAYFPSQSVQPPQPSQPRRAAPTLNPFSPKERPSLPAVASTLPSSIPGPVDVYVTAAFPKQQLNHGLELLQQDKVDTFIRRFMDSGELLDVLSDKTLDEFVSDFSGDQADYIEYVLESILESEKKAKFSADGKRFTIKIDGQQFVLKNPNGSWCIVNLHEIMPPADDEKESARR